jgi:hypothetical protein
MNLPGAIAALFVSLPLAAQAWPTFFSAYEDGLTAQGRGEHALAARAFARAIALNPYAGKGVRTYGLNYLPAYHPYLRLAEVQLALGDLEAAETALQQSAVVGGEPQAEREALAGRLRSQREARAKAAPAIQERPPMERPAEKSPSLPAVVPLAGSGPLPGTTSPPSDPPRLSAGSRPTDVKTSQPTHLTQPAPTNSHVKPSTAEFAPVPIGAGEPGNFPQATAEGPAPIAASPARSWAPWAWLAGGGLAFAIGGAVLARRRRKPAEPSATVYLERTAPSPVSSFPLVPPTQAGNIGDPNLARSFGPFLPTKILGQGGCATAYFGHHQDTGAEVAIKVPHRHLLQDGEFKARFHREASLGALLHHPRIVPILDPGPMDGEPWLAMPFIHGMTLDLYLAQKGRLEIPEAISIACDINDAISFAHSKGVVHRDLKPGNIMMTPDGAIVMDFGIARVLDVAMTVSTMFIGTPQYSAPECVMTTRVGPPADRYALGIMLFEFLAGRPPFTGESPFQILEAQRSAPLPDLALECPQVPPRLLRLIQRLCAKAPDERPEDGETKIILEELKLEHACK